MTAPKKPRDFKTTVDAEKRGEKEWFRLLLLVICPFFVQLVAAINIEFQGSFYAIFSEVFESGVVNVFMRTWGNYFFGTPTAWKIIITYIIVEVVFMKLLPGQTIKGSQLLISLFFHLLICDFST